MLWANVVYEEFEEYSEDQAVEGDVIKIENEEGEHIVINRYYECGISDVGVIYKDTDGNEIAVFDGDYTVVKRAGQRA